MWITDNIDTANVTVLDTENGHPVAVQTRFGTFRIGDVIKGSSKGATVTIMGFDSKGTQTNVKGTKNYGWRLTIKNRHA